MNSKAVQPADDVKIENLIEGAHCNCPIDCVETIYAPEISSGKLMQNSHLLQTLKISPNYLWNLTKEINDATENSTKLLKLEQREEGIEQNMSVVHFYFKEPGIIHYSRDELYGIMDLVGEYCVHLLYVQFGSNQ